nr:MAG TPA: hypothetical protein [Caudoviricetes sp.]
MCCLPNLSLFFCSCLFLPRRIRHLFRRGLAQPAAPRLTVGVIGVPFAFAVEIYAIAFRLPVCHNSRTDARLVVSVVIFNPHERSCAYHKLCKGQHTVFVIIHFRPPFPRPILPSSASAARSVLPHQGCRTNLLRSCTYHLQSRPGSQSCCDTTYGRLRTKRNRYTFAVLPASAPCSALASASLLLCRLLLPFYLLGFCFHTLHLYQYRSTQFPSVSSKSKIPILRSIFDPQYGQNTGNFSSLIVAFLLRRIRVRHPVRDAHRLVVVHFVQKLLCIWTKIQRWIVPPALYIKSDDVHSLCRKCLVHGHPSRRTAIPLLHCLFQRFSCCNGLSTRSAFAKPTAEKIIRFYQFDFSSPTERARFQFIILHSSFSFRRCSTLSRLPSLSFSFSLPIRSVCTSHTTRFRRELYATFRDSRVRNSDKVAFLVTLRTITP